MKRRFLSLLLAAALVLTLPVLAADHSMGNFVRKTTYTGQFSDLVPGSVFYDNVSALYEYGLSKGKPDGTFGLKDSVTVGQAVIFTARIRSLYQTGDPEQGAASREGKGYQPYLAYLQSEGILGHELDGWYAHAATRGQVAHLLARVLPEKELPQVNQSILEKGLQSGTYLTDVSDQTPYAQEILSLYRTGIVAGSDRQGNFYPASPISRGALAAMLTRIVDPSLRVTLDWTISDWTSAEGTTLGDLVEPGQYFAAPVTVEQMDSSIRSMLAQNSNRMVLDYRMDFDRQSATEVMDGALDLVKAYTEQGYNQVNGVYDSLGGIQLTFSATGAENQTEAYRKAALERAIAVHDQLWQEGALTSSMTEREIAAVYYDWICRNCVYDTGASYGSISHLPYSLFLRGTAVCDGYTGAYNLLLKLEGIDCMGLANEEHIWTVAQLDGEIYHIDTTWGDDERYGPNKQFFAMTPQESWQQHAW